MTVRGLLAHFSIYPNIIYFHDEKIMLYTDDVVLYKDKFVE